MGDAGLGIITVWHYDYNDDTKLNKEFVAAYNAEFKRNPDFGSVGGYDGMHVIYEALKKAGGKTDGDSLVAAAKGLSFESPRGPIQIDPETRDIVQTISIRQVRKVGERSAQRRDRQGGEGQGPGIGGQEVGDRLARDRLQG